MTKDELKQKAEEYGNGMAMYYESAHGKIPSQLEKYLRNAYIAGATENAPKWHKIFVDSEPYNYEYWECPQETLPKKQGFYFVRLKNGFVKICELKSDIFGRRKLFYNLHGGAQSNVAEWLEYPVIQDVKE